MKKTNFQKVKEFHDKYSTCLGYTRPTYPADKRILLRIRLMTEELAEVVKAMTSGETMPEIAKELADLLYVVYGTADEYGINIDEVFEEVHLSNMTKSKSKDAGGKVMKGDSYIPPNIEEVLKRASND